MYALFHGYIVTANDDGSIPLNAKIVAKVDEANEALLAELLECANLWCRKT